MGVTMVHIMNFLDSYMGVISSILIPILRFSACSRIGIQRIQWCSHHSTTVDTRRDTWSYITDGWICMYIMRGHPRKGKSRGISWILIPILKFLACRLIRGRRIQCCSRHRCRVDTCWDRGLVHCCNTDTSGCVFVRGESDVRSMLCYSQCECLCHFFVFEKGGELDHAEYYSDTLAHVEYNSDSPACHCEKFEIQFQFHGGRERSPRLHCIFTVYPWSICRILGISRGVHHDYITTTKVIKQTSTTPPLPSNSTN
jgi:hypothetical protein